MRVQVEFSDQLLASAAGIAPSDMEQILVEELMRYAQVERICLVGNAEDFSPGENADGAWEVRLRDELGWAIKISVESLSEYLSDTWRTAVFVPTSRWRECATGPDVATLLIIDDDRD